jgi:hypothetical protein
VPPERPSNRSPEPRGPPHAATLDGELGIGVRAEAVPATGLDVDVGGSKRPTVDMHTVTAGRPETPAHQLGPRTTAQERTNRPGTLDLDGLEPPPRPVQDNAGPSRAEHPQPTHERLSVR